MAELRSLAELLRPYLRWLYLHFDPEKRPDYFSACWRYPNYALDDRVPPQLVAPSRGVDFLFLPMNDWHTRIQRSHHLARALAGLGHRCFWFNPHLGCEYLKPYLMDRASRLGVLGPGLYELHVHSPREHVSHKRLLLASESRAIVEAARRLRSLAKISEAVQVVSFPIWLDVAAALKAAFGFAIVYDCHDFLGGFRKTSPEIVAQESRAFSSADLVIFSAETLMRRALRDDPSLDGKSVLMRNGVEPAHFRPALPKPAGVQKVAGYAGALDHWFDVVAVETAARDHPDWTFQLIGRVEDERLNTLRRLSNVEFAGELPYAELPAFLARFDVALIPFLVNDLTRAANPIKLYEYFSLGLPVVSSRLPEVELYAELVYLADTPGQFSAQLSHAAGERGAELRERRMAVAEKESWDHRAAQLLEGVTRVRAAAR